MEIIRKLGQGGFGETFLAEYEGRRIVVKTFKPALHNDSKKALELFRDEAQKLRVLGNHRQIPEYVNFAETGGELQIWQEFIPGQSLRTIIDSQSNFTEAQALNLLDELLIPLKYLHRNGFIHRDIKPSNIILNQGVPYLVDFGTATELTRTVLQKTQTVIGSPLYAAVEQLNGKAIPASDIYSLGITMIELMTGLNPLEFNCIETGENIWGNLINADPAFIKILDKMTARYQKDRYLAVSEINKDLQTLKDGNIAISVPRLPQKAFIPRRFSIPDKLFIPGALVILAALSPVFLGDIFSQKAENSINPETQEQVSEAIRPEPKTDNSSEQIQPSKPTKDSELKNEDTTFIFYIFKLSIEIAMIFIVLTAFIQLGLGLSQMGDKGTPKVAIGVMLLIITVIGSAMKPRLLAMLTTLETETQELTNTVD